MQAEELPQAVETFVLSHWGGGDKAKNKNKELFLQKCHVSSAVGNALNEL